MQELAGTTGPKKNRFLSLDIIRGIALFGILLMNITEFGLPFSYENPSAFGDAEGIDLIAWMITTLLFEGTQRGLFSILFGAGVILLTSRLESSNIPNNHDIYFRRNLWLVFFGMIHAYILLWPGDILFSYGVTALFVYSFRHLAAKNLLVIAAATLVFSVSLNLYDTYQTNRSYQKYLVAKQFQEKEQLSTKQKSHIDDWREIVKSYKPDPYRIQKEIDRFQGSYLELAKHLASRSAHNESWWSYRSFFDWFSMMLVGMALFKMGVLTLRRSTRFYLAMMIGGYLFGLPVNYYEITSIVAGDLSAAAFVKSNITYDIGRLAMTCGHLGLLLLFVRSRILSRLQSAFAAVGRMALTNYVLHSVICGIIFYGLGFGLYAKLARHELYLVVLFIWLAQLIFSPLWLRYYCFGPVEWLWRSLTYLKLQPMKKNSHELPKMNKLVRPSGKLV